MTDNLKFGEWGYYFSQNYATKSYDALKSEAWDETGHFLREIERCGICLDDGLDNISHRPELDAWVAANDVMLTKLVRDLQTHIQSTVEYALPAHDERQIDFKDASEGLRYYWGDKPTGYKSTFVIPMFIHDIGRLLEGRLYTPEENAIGNWIPHSQLSFLLLKKIIDKPDYADMPYELKAHFLYAVLAHSGDNGKSFMSRAVQTCDRMQLIGAEGFFRALSFASCLMDADIKYPSDDTYIYNLPSMYDHKSVLSILEYCSRNMRENIGEGHREWQKRIAVENVAILKMACRGNDDLYSRIFAPEITPNYPFERQKQPIPAEIMNAAEELYRSKCRQDAVRHSPFEVSTEIISLLNAPIGASQLKDKMKKSVSRAVSEMSDAERCSFAQTLTMAAELRAEQDEIDHALCVDIQNSHAPQFVKAIAEKAAQYYSPKPYVGHKVEIPFQLSGRAPV
jgi:hypothetical protein